MCKEYENIKIYRYTIMDLNVFYNKHKSECSKLHDVYINCIPDNGICFDIGSNMGMYSETLLEKKNVFIHLFEYFIIYL